MTKFLNTYRVESNRLKGFDYGSNGYYFVTICTYKKNKYFGQLCRNVETEYIPFLLHAEMGIIATNCWYEIPKHFSFVELDEFVIMPDHLHGILKFKKENKLDHVPNQFKSPYQNLGSIIRSYKGAVQRYATRNNLEFKWQPGYHDRIIRDTNALTEIRNYIINNPLHLTEQK